MPFVNTVNTNFLNCPSALRYPEMECSVAPRTSTGLPRRCSRVSSCPSQTEEFHRRPCRPPSSRRRPRPPSCWPWRPPGRTSGSHWPAAEEEEEEEGAVAAAESRRCLVRPSGVCRRWRARDATQCYCVSQGFFLVERRSNEQHISVQFSLNLIVIMG